MDHVMQFFNDQFQAANSALEINEIFRAADVEEEIMEIDQKMPQNESELEANHQYYKLDTCSICMNELRKDIVVINSCGHCLHKECHDMLKKSNTSSRYKCPLCRCRIQSVADVRLPIIYADIPHESNPSGGDDGEVNKPDDPLDQKQIDFIKMQYKAKLEALNETFQSKMEECNRLSQQMNFLIESKSQLEKENIEIRAKSKNQYAEFLAMTHAIGKYKQDLKRLELKNNQQDILLKSIEGKAEMMQGHNPSPADFLLDSSLTNEKFKEECQAKLNTAVALLLAGEATRIDALSLKANAEKEAREKVTKLVERYDDLVGENNALKLKCAKLKTKLSNLELLQTSNSIVQDDKIIAHTVVNNSADKIKSIEKPVKTLLNHETRAVKNMILLNMNKNATMSLNDKMQFIKEQENRGIFMTDEKLHASLNTVCPKSSYDHLNGAIPDLSLKRKVTQLFDNNLNFNETVLSRKSYDELGRPINVLKPRNATENAEKRMKPNGVIKDQEIKEVKQVVKIREPKLSGDACSKQSNLNFSKSADKLGDEVIEID